MKWRRRLRFPVGGAAFAASLAAAKAGAHEVGLSRGDYAVEGASVKAQVVFARKELIGLVAGLDADHDGALTAGEVAAARGAIEGALVGRIRVTGDGAACPGALERAELTEQDGIAVQAVYRCGRRPGQLAVELAFLDDLPFGHRHLARASAGASSIDRVLSQRSPSLTLPVPAEAAPEIEEARPEPGVSPLRRGALHVLARPWSPAFLLAVLVTSSGWRPALFTAAAFAAAAAAALGLGVRGIFMPSPRALGAAIALSLVYVGVEAVGGTDGAARWQVALPFGVVHGLGAAAAFQAGGSGLWAFGAGAAIALVATLAVLLPAAQWARRRALFAGRGLRALGAAIAAAGAVGLLTGRT
jgi:hypothetical protein